MFKSELSKLLITSIVTVFTISTISLANENESSYNGLWNAKEDISGGLYYPIKNNQTGPYKVNPQV